MPSQVAFVRHSLNMGGRSLSEAKASQKTMFKQLKEKFNKAAEAPGFFEIQGSQVDVELYCKSNRDGTQIGDCPFTQFIQVFHNDFSSAAFIQ